MTTVIGGVDEVTQAGAAVSLTASRLTCLVVFMVEFEHHLLGIRFGVYVLTDT